MQEKVRELLARAGLGSATPATLIALCVLVAVVAGMALWRWWPRTEPASVGVVASEARAVEPEGARTKPATAAPEPTLFVHVVGSVRHPGLYELPGQSRVADAIDAAGGTLPDAKIEFINLARPVSDGEQIAVPDEDAEAPPTSGASSAGTDISGAAAGATGAPIDLNSADAAALDTLPGVGPSTAQKIIADRESNGPFTTVEDLGRVSGIGPKRLEQLKDLVCVR